MVSGLHRLAARLLTAFVLLFALPGVSDVVEEVAALATGVELCGAECDEGGGPGCPGMCTHCTCCAAASALAVAPGLALSVQTAVARPPISAALAAYASGYSAELFRPPAA